MNSFCSWYRQLVGMAEEFADLRRKQPESACRAYKAGRVNRVLALFALFLQPTFSAPGALAAEGRVHH